MPDQHDLQRTIPTLDYASSSQRLPHSGYGIAAVAILVADIPWFAFFHWPFGYPKQQNVGMVAWLLAGALTLAAFRTPHRNRVFARLALACFIADVFILSVLLPTY